MKTKNNISIYSINWLWNCNQRMFLN